MKLAKFFDSLEAVMIPMVMIMIAFMVDASVLFYKVFPEMNHYLKLVSSCFIGFATVAPLLLSSVNSELLKENGLKIGFPEIFAGCTFCLTVFFFNLFQAGQPVIWYCEVSFLCLFLTAVDYLFATLFVKKFRQKKEEAELKDQVNQLSQENSKNSVILKSTQQALKESSQEIKLLSEELKKHHEALTCKHCGLQSETYGQHKNHVNRCSKNPKNKQL